MIGPLGVSVVAFVVPSSWLWKHPPCSSSARPRQNLSRVASLWQQASSSSAAASEDTTPSPIRTFTGPVLLATDDQIVAGFEVQELGLDFIVAPSVVAAPSGSLGLFVVLSDGVTSTTLPALQLLCGYGGGRQGGSFEYQDQGDKTVGFAMTSLDTAVVFEQEFMTLRQALQKAHPKNAKHDNDNHAALEYCGLAGHVVLLNEKGEMDQVQVDTDSDLARYFVPINPLDKDSNHESSTSSTINIQNLGQFCNDLAWSFTDPPASQAEYEERSRHANAVQLAWRLEYDPQSKSLIPTWPVSVLADDFIFQNDEVMELGTRYGWNYWQATVDFNKL